MIKFACNNVWKWVRTIGSCLVFFAVACLFWKVHWTSVGGAYELTSPNDLSMSVSLASVYTYFTTNFSGLMPISALVGYLFTGIGSDGAVLISLAFALDMVIWFNVLVYAVQLILFLPSWILDYAERVVKGGKV